MRFHIALRNGKLATARYKNSLLLRAYVSLRRSIVERVYGMLRKKFPMSVAQILYNFYGPLHEHAQLCSTGLEEAFFLLDRSTSCPNCSAVSSDLP